MFRAQLNDQTRWSPEVANSIIFRQSHLVKYINQLGQQRPLLNPRNYYGDLLNKTTKRKLIHRVHHFIADTARQLSGIWRL